MLGENILDETHPENVQFANCKIKYLLAQNKLTNIQLASVSQLVQKYKQIIDILSKQRQDTTQFNIQNDNSVQQIIKSANQIIENCVKQCKDVSNNKNVFQDQQSTITPQFFSQLVLSYEKTIAQLKFSIHQRQILLQQLQKNPNHIMKKPQDQSQNSTITKAVQSYDIYPKISQKCRKEILNLKQKKKKFQTEHLAKDISQSLQKGESKTNNIDKTIKIVSNNCRDPCSNLTQKSQLDVQSMSPFQKTILIYKKKKIFNDILQSKVIQLKKKIKEKEQCNRILKKRLQNQVWQNIEKINTCGRNLDDDDPAYLSMLNQSLRANNIDFSVDISRVLPGAIRIQNQSLNLNNILKEVNQNNQNQ